MTVNYVRLQQPWSGGDVELVVRSDEPLPAGTYEHLVGLAEAVQAFVTSQEPSDD